MGLVALAGLTIGLVGCRPSEGGEAQAEEPDVADTTGARIVNVEVEHIAPSTFVDYIRITGEVEALYDVTISAEESGSILRFLVEKGARVRRGQVIAKIDDAVLSASVREAEALADVAREQYARQRRLWEEEGIGSEIAYLQAQSNATAAEARVEMFQARLARTEVKAPVSGIFDEKFVEVGEMVTPGAPVARVVSVGQVKITGGVPERYALFIHRGDSARVTLDPLGDREFFGTIQFVGTSVEPRSRTFPIEIVLQNPGNLIKPRMVANVQVERERLTDVVVVPQQVVVRTESGYQVFIVAARNGHPVAEARAVMLGPSFENRTVVTTGLAVGDQLITVGGRLVDDGSFVRVIASVGGEG
jgi:RND family efflux transporter MFP subunit